MALGFVYNISISKRKEWHKMPNFTTPIPPKLSGNAEADIGKIKRWGTALVDELSYLFNNLDCKNVIEAGTVKAENIDTTTAKITNAQIGTLTADKLAAGTVDTEKVTVKDKNGKLTISGSEITVSDGRTERFCVAYDKQTGKFEFILRNAEGEQTVGIDSAGDAHFGGVVEGSRIFSSTIIGTDSASYNENSGGVFAEMDQTGVKVMQDADGSRSQKIGMSVADDGTAYLVLGAGDGTGKTVINGVVCTNGSFKIEKNDTCTGMGIVGGSAFVTFWDNGQLWLNGSTVKINGTDIMSEINQIKQKLNSLTTA